jgi:DnaK suppressor protein
MGKLDRLGMLGIKREPAGRFAPSVPTAIIPLIEPSEVLAVVPEPIQDLDIIVGPPGEYRPSPDEPFMCPAQLEYFRGKLIAWRQDVMREAKETLDHLQSAGTTEMADEVDRANEIVDRERELTARERQLKLVGKIDAALRRIDDGSYGYCLETGEALSLRRLDARPIATLSVEAQERHEKRERVFRDGSVEPTV